MLICLILARESGVHGTLDGAENVAETKKYTQILTLIIRENLH